MHTLATSKLFFAGFLMFSAALAHAIPCAPPPVILVSIDGLGAHLFSLARMPELKKLIEQGAMAREAYTTDLMKTLPDRASMLSGLTPAGHGIKFNETETDGHGGSHGRRNAKGEIEDTEREMKIPFIVYGATLKSPMDLVNIIDTAPAIAELLQLPVPAEWNWKGQSRVTGSCPKL